MITHNHQLPFAVCPHVWSDQICAVDTGRVRVSGRAKRYNEGQTEYALAEGREKRRNRKRKPKSECIQKANNQSLWWTYWIVAIVDHGKTKKHLLLLFEMRFAFLLLLCDTECHFSHLRNWPNNTQSVRSSSVCVCSRVHIYGVSVWLDLFNGQTMAKCIRKPDLQTIDV